VYHKLGLSDPQIKQFLVGPAYLPFGWMGCIDGWGGPLPDSWISKHADLQSRILARERELGMIPVLQGFTGHVPKTLLSIFPQAKLQQLPSWAQFPSTYFLDPHDPLFACLGRMFIQEQTRQFGTDHLYASDTFIEMTPPSNEPEFLASMGRTIYEAMRSGDPESTWVLQGWIFVNQPEFWKVPQGRAFLGAVPDDRLVVLDLFCENTPVWPKTESFFGKPWIWCVLHNFGGLAGIYGDLPRMSEEVTKARTNSDRGKLSGIGLTFEGIDYNPIVQDFLTETAWHRQLPPLDQWVAQFAHRRYGRSFPETEQAWDILRNTLYKQGGPAGSILIERPSLKPTVTPEIWRYQANVLRALDLLLAKADELDGVETYRFDLVNLTRELLVAQGARRVTEALQAYQARDTVVFDEATCRLRQLFQDVDELLSTDRNFLLGVWLESAKHWASTDKELRLYEWNARNLITLWGPPDSTLHEYAARQWSGMFKGFYQKRWDLFLDRLRQAMVENRSLDVEKVSGEIRAWEEQWTHQTETYPTNPRRDAIKVARRTLERYKQL
jgi:alpha-N-acetylglucosaminidase